MKKSNFVLAETFYKFREKPKWLVNMILCIVLELIIVWILMSTTSESDTLTEEQGISDPNNEMLTNFVKVLEYIIPGLSVILGIVMSSIIFLIISKLMKSDVKVSSLFAATTFITLIFTIIDLIVVSIQALFKLDPEQYSITSLAVFDQDNIYLGVFDLGILIEGYLIAILLYETSRLSGKASIIWSVVMVVISIIISLIIA
ncbi:MULTISPECIES: YIP1 family protein [unclassified Mammaliicoccus]|uniref:YIP1 family protein n=1 Tax=unclassified Mammaliicoccus TaxID=2803851 RepID=UPI001EFB89E2|nr:MULTISPECIES: YIP1 family protein [unclassified Mammaliicoccus]